MWYFDTPIGRAAISKMPGKEMYCFSFNDEPGDQHRNPKVLADNAFCHSVGVWEWDNQSRYDVPDDIREWSRG